MTAKQLLQELETLPYAARIRRMVELGRTAVHDPQLATILTTLEQGDFYARFLALHACFGSRDGAHVLRALTEPSRIIRGLAIELVPLTCNETQLRQALQAIPRDGRRALLWQLHHHGYHTLIDDYLRQLVATDDLQLLQLLPYGSPALVRQQIAHIQPLMKLADWRRLARHHPALAGEFLSLWAASVASLDLQLLTFANGILPILAKKQPDGAVQFVEMLTRSVSLSRLDLKALLLQRPAQLADLVLQNPDDLGLVDFSVVAHKLNNERLLALHNAYPGQLESPSAEWGLQRLSPARRAEFYTLLVPRWRDQEGYDRITAGTIALLPHPLREQEGRRFLALPSLAMYPEKRLAYAACLPWNEARDVLDPFLHDPGEKVRTVALQTLVQVTRYEREHLLEVLQVVQAHLHEPDPICYALLDSLNELPRSIWRTEHLASMEAIVQSVINTFDSSPSTLGALFLLITRLLERAPEWSATRFAQIAQARGITFAYGCIDNRLSDADVRQLGPALRPILTSWAEKGDEEKLQYLLAVFGKRVRVFEELLDALEIVFHRPISFDFGNRILLALSDYRPARAAQLIPELIQRDRNWITYPAVLTYLLNWRQDLLTPFLKHQKYSDLFNGLQAETSYRRRRRGPRPLIRGYARWTARQQIRFARTLREVILDETNTHDLIGRAIARLFALPAIPNDHWLALTKNQQPVVRDLTLIHLRQLDNTTPILPLLLEALQDERAVRAMYALRPCLLTLPPQEALAILRAIPLARVTIAKEVVRLVGDLPGEEAFQALLALDGQALHRDVRVALVRALGRHLERDDAWRILEREARSADKTIAVSTARLSLSPTPAKAYHARKSFRRTEHDWYSLHHFFWFSEWNTVTMTHLAGEHLSLKAQQRLMRLFALLLARPELDVRAAVLRGCTRLSAVDEGQELLRRLLAAMDADDEEICAAAASAIFGTSVANDAEVIAQAVGRLLANRRALVQIRLVLQQTHAINRRQLIPIARAIIAALAVDPLTIALRVELAMVSLPWDEVATILTEAAATDALHADALHRACLVSDLVLGRYGKIGRPDSKEIVRLEETLAASHDERLRRIALATLAAQAEEAHGWNTERRARLEAYCADPSPLVAAAAQFTVIPQTEA